MGGVSGWVSWAVLAVVALWPAVVLAEETCTPGQGDIACDAREFGRLAELYEVPPLEDYAARGATVRRAFFVDPFRRNVVMVSFLREPAGAPVVRVTWSTLGYRLDQRTLTIESPVSDEVWTGLIDQSNNLKPIDETAQSPPVPGQPQAICMDGSSAALEMSGQMGTTHSKPVKRIVVSACGKSAGYKVAKEMADAALSYFRACSDLTYSKSEDAPSLLSLCARLDGKVGAAVVVANQIDSPAVFGSEATLEWPGLARMTDRDAVVAFWAAHSDPGKGYFPAVGRITGEADNRVVLRGIIVREIEGQSDVFEDAAFEQTLEKEVGGFAIVSIKVGAFSPSPPSPD